MQQFAHVQHLLDLVHACHDISPERNDNVQEGLMIIKLAI